MFISSSSFLFSQISVNQKNILTCSKSSKDRAQILKGIMLGQAALPTLCSYLPPQCHSVPLPERLPVLPHLFQDPHVLEPDSHRLIKDLLFRGNAKCSLNGMKTGHLLLAIKFFSVIVHLTENKANVKHAIKAQLSLETSAGPSLSEWPAMVATTTSSASHVAPLANHWLHATGFDFFCLFFICQTVITLPQIRSGAFFPPVVEILSETSCAQLFRLPAQRTQCSFVMSQSRVSFIDICCCIFCTEIIPHTEFHCKDVTVGLA